MSIKNFKEFVTKLQAGELNQLSAETITGISKQRAFEITEKTKSRLEFLEWFKTKEKMTEFQMGYLTSMALNNYNMEMVEKDNQSVMYI